MWQVCGIKEDAIDVNQHCYAAMDQLFSRKEKIEKKLAEKHLTGDCIVLYDITSSYLEGEYEKSDLVSFGYNRDKKKGHPQIVIGLICNKEGCPVSVEVFKGNTSDGTTVDDQILKVKDKFGVKEAIFVGDRGMLTRKRMDEVQPGDDEYVKTISALTRGQIASLTQEHSVQLSLLDPKTTVEFTDKDNSVVRYGVCLNPVRKEEETTLRKKLIALTEKDFTEVQNRVSPVTDDKVGIRVGKVINKHKVGKYFDITIRDGKLSWKIDQEKIAEDENLDGVYIIYTDVSEKTMPIQEVVDTYRKLIGVEQAFRNMKQAELYIRPICHKTDERIEAHVFICMLAYYVMWNMKQCLAPLLDSNRASSNRPYTFDLIIDRLKSLREEECIFEGVIIHKHTLPDGEQQRIFDLLQVRI